MASYFRLHRTCWRSKNTVKWSEKILESANKIWYRVSECQSIIVVTSSTTVLFFHTTEDKTDNTVSITSVWQPDRTSGSHRRLIGHFNPTVTALGQAGQDAQVTTVTAHPAPGPSADREDKEDLQFPISLPDFTICQWWESDKRHNSVQLLCSEFTKLDEDAAKAVVLGPSLKDENVSCPPNLSK